MKSVTSYYRKLKDHHARFGFAKTAVYVADSLINRVMRAECYHIIVLDRDEAGEHSAASTTDVSIRLATREELVEMRKQGTWAIGEFLLERAAEGDLCFLNFCGDELAGYTWANLNGHPLLIPNLRLRMPDQYIYNYAGFTLPKFRGSGLHSVRHRAVARHARLGKRTLGLIAYVSYANWASMRGQTRSGFRRIGKLWLIGSKNHFLVFRSRAIRELGIERVHESARTDVTRCMPAK